MQRMKLVIGNPNYSSWSMRGWLALKWAGIEFETEIVHLYEPRSRERLFALGAEAGKVPFVVSGGHTVWESLSLLEFAHDQTGKIWPSNARKRATARSLAAEMHAGFASLRTGMPMNIRAHSLTAKRDNAFEEELARVKELWTCAEGFLVGEFSGADIMFAPMAQRFRTYQIEMEGREKNYYHALLEHPLVQEWCELAWQDTSRIEKFEL